MPENEGMENKRSLFNYSRRRTHTVHIGKLTLGGISPIRVQSMANTNTNDTEASIEQSIRIIRAGGEMVRFTAQGEREARNLESIRQGLNERGYSSTPLVADIHFNPKAADEAALHVEKIRINPGNYTDSTHLAKTTYTEEEYQEGLQKIREKFIPFLDLCKAHGRAIRIGVNHGSLSDRIMSRYGDTPEGMSESCLEFLRICRERDFADAVVSVKSSNTVVMVETVRLLADKMDSEGLDYPIHLGVTEAGDGEDGRIKSAVGIGALLADGIGDTIRVSLSEEPENEIPVAKFLVNYIQQRTFRAPLSGHDSGLVPRYSYKRRQTTAVGIVGGGQVPVVVVKKAPQYGIKPDFAEEGLDQTRTIKPLVEADAGNVCNCVKATRLINMQRLKGIRANIKFLIMDAIPSMEYLQKNVNPETVLVLECAHVNPLGYVRSFVHKALEAGLANPLIVRRKYIDATLEAFMLKSAADMGPLLIEGLVDGIWLEGSRLPDEFVTQTSFTILQAARSRFSKTEYISCPSCGRTLYDMQTTIAKIKQATQHLKNLKIGIMGCVVNGPGEMADADYGYVGSGVGCVNLYKGQECVEKMIKAEEAVERLVQLIKANGDWCEPADAGEDQDQEPLPAYIPQEGEEIPEKPQAEAIAEPEKPKRVRRTKAEMAAARAAEEEAKALARANGEIEKPKRVRRTKAEMEAARAAEAEAKARAAGQGPEQNN